MEYAENLQCVYDEWMQDFTYINDFFILEKTCSKLGARILFEIIPWNCGLGLNFSDLYQCKYSSRVKFNTAIGQEKVQQNIAY